MANDLTHPASINPHLTRLERASFMLQQALREAVQASRDLYADANVSDMRIDVEIIGRVHGDLKINFRAGETYGATGQVNSFDLNNSINEFLKRKGWDKRNAPQCLTYSGEEKPEDETPF